MVAHRKLTPALELAAKNKFRFPKESVKYRQARNALLAEEIELRRHIERVAEKRRSLPDGGEVPQNHRFEGEHGPTTLEDMFGDHDSLVIYSFMFGPQRARPCPMCTSVLGAWDGNARDVEQRVALAAVARSPIGRIVDFKRERGWQALKVYSDPTGDYTRDYVSADDEDVPALNVFTRRDGVIRHFWAGEMGAETADPGQDPRGAPDIAPLWTIFDLTPNGRGGDWYPKLTYSARASS